MTREAELAEAFAPCTLPGLVDSWHRMNMEINAIRKDRDNLAVLLLDASVKGAVWHIDPAFRVGMVIEGEQAKAQAVWRLTEGGENPKWQPHLEYIRERK